MPKLSFPDINVSFLFVPCHAFPFPFLAFPFYYLSIIFLLSFYPILLLLPCSFLSLFSLIWAYLAFRYLSLPFTFLYLLFVTLIFLTLSYSALPYIMASVLDVSIEASCVQPSLLCISVGSHDLISERQASRDMLYINHPYAQAYRRIQQQFFCWRSLSYHLRGWSTKRVWT